MTANTYDLIIIGAGPGGYVAAIRAAQLGMNIACVEEEKALGGTCLRIGCIPSKALLEATERYWEAAHSSAEFGFRIQGVDLDLPAMLKRKDTIVKGLTDGVDFLFKKNKITRYLGRGRLDGAGKVIVDGPDGSSERHSQRILIATGSRPATLKGVDMAPGPAGAGKKRSAKAAVPLIGTSTDALSYPEVPKRLAVIGAGYIGLEMGSVWRRLGSEVTVLEYLDRILPGMDAEMASEGLKLLKRQGINFRLGSIVNGARQDGGECTVETEGSEPLHSDRVLVAVGRVPNTEGLGLETVGIQPQAKGFIPVDEHYATSAPGVYAIGDVIGGAMLAHKASEEGVACVEAMAGGYGHVNYDAIPGVVYTQPEMAAVGKTEEQLKDGGVSYRKGMFQFRANGRARCLGQTDGWIKILADSATDRIVGVHIIGPRAGDLIAEAAVAIEFGASSEDIARSPHAHPTLAEVMKEAALAVDGRTIHS